MSFGKETKVSVVLVITREGGDAYEEDDSKHRQLNVFEGEKIERGDVIADGPQTPHDILRLQWYPRSNSVHTQTKFKKFTAYKA